jgi:uncharacterized protein (DUF2164 family)
VVLDTSCLLDSCPVCLTKRQLAELSRYLKQHQNYDVQKVAELISLEFLMLGISQYSHGHEGISADASSERAIRLQIFILS